MRVCTFLAPLNGGEWVYAGVSDSDGCIFPDRRTGKGGLTVAKGMVGWAKWMRGGV